MDGHGKSDRPVVPANLPNKPGEPGAQAGEGRGLREGNTASETRPGRGAGLGVSSDLDRVRQVARKDRNVRFTALLHHVTVDRLREAYRAISPNAAAGVDGVTWRDYGLDLDENLRDLHARVHRGAYRARPSRRVFIPKPDGRLRPLGVAAVNLTDDCTITTSFPGGEDFIARRVTFTSTGVEVGGHAGHLSWSTLDISNADFDTLLMTPGPRHAPPRRAPPRPANAPKPRGTQAHGPQPTPITTNPLTTQPAATPRENAKPARFQGLLRRHRSSRRSLQKSRTR